MCKIGTFDKKSILEKLNKYKTIHAKSEGLYKEKGSKFIGYVVPCYDEDEAKTYLEEWKKEHHQARHWCYAYRFGLHKDVYRANDDGEPSNSAGAPILGQIQSFDLTNVLICVVRYFGGTKLGVGGLIHAYRAAAKEAIENGKIIEVTVHQWMDVNFEYPEMPGIMKFVKDNNLIIKEQVFELSCKLRLGVPLEIAEMVEQHLEELDNTKLTDLGIY